MDKAQASSPAIPTAHQMESRTDGGNDDDVTLNPFRVVSSRMNTHLYAH